MSDLWERKCEYYQENFIWPVSQLYLPLGWREGKRGWYLGTAAFKRGWNPWCTVETELAVPIRQKMQNWGAVHLFWLWSSGKLFQSWSFSNETQCKWVGKFPVSFPFWLRSWGAWALHTYPLPVVWNEEFQNFPHIHMVYHLLSDSILLELQS